MTRTATHAVGRRRWTLAAGIVAAGFALLATVAPGRAAAAPPPSPLELAGQVEASVTTQVDAAVTQANDVLAAAQTPAQAAPSVRVSVQVPAQATPTIGVDGVPPIQADVVVPPAPGTAAPAPVATHGIATSRPAGTAATKKRADTTRPRAAPPPRTVASPFLHPGIGASIAGRGSAAAAASAAQSSSHVSTRRETPRARTPELPLPFGPTGPALPDSGAASPGGQGSGAGAPLLVLLAVLGGLTVFGIPILLRKVLWSDLWMPRLVALPPWRPG